MVVGYFVRSHRKNEKRELFVLFPEEKKTCIIFYTINISMNTSTNRQIQIYT